MDLLRNLGSAAVSSIVQKSGLNLPFSLGEKNQYFEGKSIWSLYDGTKRDDGTPVSVLVFDSNAPHSSKKYLPLAKNALRKLRTVRHPDVLKFIDAVDSDSTVYIMAERVRPLGQVLNSSSSQSEKVRDEWKTWGLQRIATALAFVNGPCDSTHGNLNVNSVFLSASGEWRLGGFDLLSNAKDTQAVLYTLGGTLPDANTYASPEVKKGGWTALKEHHPSVADAYALGILVHSVFNTKLPLPATCEPPHPPPAPSTRGSIPNALFGPFKRLLNPNAKARLSPAAFLELGMAQTGDNSGFFAKNTFVQLCTGLDQYNLSSDGEKAALLKSLKEAAPTLPPDFAAFRVLPTLVSALEFGGATANVILPIVLQLGTHASPTDYPTVVLAPVTKLFGSADRGTRMALLEHLPEYVEKLDNKTAVDKIWPNLQTGFADTVAPIREATVKSIGLLYPKFNDRILNNDLLRHLARMQSDPEAAIRTNTCILIGRIGPSLGYNTKRKVLVAAFAKALKDSFVHARVAGLMAFMATIDCFDMEDLATKVIPSVSGALIDREKLVRDQAFKAMDLFVKKLESHAETMPETALNDNAQPTVQLPGAMGQNALVNSAAGAAGTLASWAMSSISRKMVASEAQSTMSTSGPSSNLASTTDIKQQTILTPTSTASSPASTSAPAPSKPTVRGMQLGGAKKQNPASTIDSWADNDLMDVNADEGDWTAFESAPAPSASGSGNISKLRSPSGLGFETPSLAIDDSDDWGALDDSAADNASTADAWGSDLFTPQSTQRSPRASLSPIASPKPQKPKFQARPSNSPAATISSSLAKSPSPRPSLNPSPAATPPMSPVPSNSTVGMSKEDKVAEMARRKEERKLRIAMLKEQKKQGVAKT